jgi:hypothetical protein
MLQEHLKLHPGPGLLMDELTQLSQAEDPIGKLPNLLKGGSLLHADSHTTAVLLKGASYYMFILIFSGVESKVYSFFGPKHIFCFDRFGIWGQSDPTVIVSSELQSFADARGYFGCLYRTGKKE